MNELKLLQGKIVYNIPESLGYNSLGGNDRDRRGVEIAKGFS